MKRHSISSIYFKIARMNLILVLPTVFFSAFLDNPGKLLTIVAGISFPFLLLSAVMSLVVFSKPENKLVRIIYTICLIGALPLLCGGIFVTLILIFAFIYAIFGGLVGLFK